MNGFGSTPRGGQIARSPILYQMLAQDYAPRQVGGIQPGISDMGAVGSIASKMLAGYLLGKQKRQAETADRAMVEGMGAKPWVNPDIANMDGSPTPQQAAQIAAGDYSGTGVSSATAGGLEGAVSGLQSLGGGNPYADRRLANLLLMEEQRKQKQEDVANQFQQQKELFGLKEQAGLAKEGRQFDRSQDLIEQRELAARERANMLLSPEKKQERIDIARAAALNKPMTEGQSNAALYADRMREAENILADPEILQSMTEKTEHLKSAVPGVGDYLVSDEFAMADQAKRNFINAVLRRESGAVISPEEFDNANKQYFPMPGNSDELLAQKAANRRTAIAGVSRAAGPTYRPLTGNIQGGVDETVFQSPRQPARGEIDWSGFSIERQ